uniref:Reverse transcriptase domain-containing protein n=1 Tax=Astyanax mexicanus TaxID=7994 RepID=A0A3B1JSL1_ASTMX
MSSKTTTCALDPLPTNLTKACVPALLPHLTVLINQSLLLGQVPSVYKTAAVTPILKKPGLDPSDLNNYRPISNLPFLSKVLERTVACQLQHYLESQNLFEPFQSGFRPFHSTETALVKVINDLLVAADAGALNILLLLDLSAAFDTINHSILLSRLCELGIVGTALDWFSSYLTDRKQFISLAGYSSHTSVIKHGVPQGSVLGPLLFIIYILPLGPLLRHFNLDFHCYADDTQIYLSTSSINNPPTTHLESCLSAIQNWMKDNFLMLNSNKTELILISTKAVLNQTPTLSLNFGGTVISPSTQVRNLGVLLDSTLSFTAHINSVVKTAFFHLRRIAKIRRSLTQSTAEILLHAFISSRLDYCNSLLAGISSSSIHKLQMVQNAAARLLTHTRTHEHITPVLQNLHWLPVKYRIQFKILLLTYKALNNLAPPYLSNLLLPYRPSRSLRSATAGLLKVPASKLRGVGDRAFSRLAPQLILSHLRSNNPPLFPC